LDGKLKRRKEKSHMPKISLTFSNCQISWS